MFCDKCGCQLREEAEFCPNCGTPVARSFNNGYGSADLSRGEYQPQSAPTSYNGYQTPNTQTFAGAVQHQPSGFSKALLAVMIVLAVGFIAAAGLLAYSLIARSTDPQSVSPTPAAVVQTESLTEEAVTQAAAAEAQPQTEAPATEIPVALDNAVAFSGAIASSVLPDQAGHNYSASNVLDKNGTCWCENASGYGEGEWIRLDLPEKQLLSGLYIINGYSGTQKQYNANSIPEKINIAFSDGSSVDVELNVFGASKRNTPQDIQFSEPIATEYVKITILSVSKGGCEDTCLSYVAPY
ncbi:MAG: discoidin domain-containing protein [Ruminococcus sp.]|nr:discoidin domain-containing protein [Ruminococcus sp.]